MVLPIVGWALSVSIKTISHSHRHRPGVYKPGWKGKAESEMSRIWSSWEQVPESPSYLLQLNMEHIEVFLQRTEQSIYSKGLELLETSLLRLEDSSLCYQYLEIKSFLAVPQGLVKVMTLCPIETLRKKGLALLQLYIDKLDSQGKYTLFRCVSAEGLGTLHCSDKTGEKTTTETVLYGSVLPEVQSAAALRYEQWCLLNTSNHSGVEAFVIQNIKNQIDLSFKKTYNKWFAGAQLISLLDLVLSLPEGAETDLLQNSDRIMASLNLLRYLVIKDNEDDNQQCMDLLSNTIITEVLIGPLMPHGRGCCPARCLRPVFTVLRGKGTRSRFLFVAVCHHKNHHTGEMINRRPGPL
ncbi:Glomulin [Apodemus speciosus]|uniref:Glomulin n=1 Tax=Apodemus speciosus TaxID=105296 RepID=A0ABQ0ESC9_APOSI